MREPRSLPPEIPVWRNTFDVLLPSFGLTCCLKFTTFDSIKLPNSNKTSFSISGPLSLSLNINGAGFSTLSCPISFLGLAKVLGRNVATLLLRDVILVLDGLDVLVERNIYKKLPTGVSLVWLGKSDKKTKAADAEIHIFSKAYFF